MDVNCWHKKALMFVHCNLVQYYYFLRMNVLSVQSTENASILFKSGGVGPETIVCTWFGLSRN